MQRCRWLIPDSRGYPRTAWARSTSHRSRCGRRLSRGARLKRLDTGPGSNTAARGLLILCVPAGRWKLAGRRFGWNRIGRWMTRRNRWCSMRRTAFRSEARRPGAADSVRPRWALEIGRQEIRLESHWSVDDPPEPLVLDADNSICHVTLLGLMETNGAIRLPAIMHFPDQGSFRISATPKAIKALGYETGPGDMGGNQAKAVKITFPGATREIPVVKYRWEVLAMHPKVAAIGADVRFDGFRRNWLNILQLSPHWRMLANHAASDTCAFCYYEYADIAERTPALARGVTALDLVRQTLDRIMGGANAYGMPGHGAFPQFSADTLPSLLIAAQA